MKTKCCSKCASIKDVTEFHKRGSGYQPMCKVCKKERSQQRYKDNRETILEVNKRWREDNPEKMAKCRSNWERPAGYSAFHRSIGRAKDAGGIHRGYRVNPKVL